MINITIKKNWIEGIKNFFARRDGGFWVIACATAAALAATAYDFAHDYIVRYGDAESHLNIAKRVVDSLTPGFAQLGGIWLPLPHLLMVPLVHINFLWRSGLAGSIVSGLAFIVAAYYLYQTTELITHNKLASFCAALVFIVNPNVLYLQSTPMTEVLLIAFFTLSSYYFILFLQGQNQLRSVLFSAFYGFCAVLTRYDGWFLVVVEAGCILLYYLPWRRIPNFRQIREFFKSKEWKTAQGYTVMFSTLAFFGIIIWLVWGYLILGDPLYFTHSEFSAKSQQNSWLARGELPAYRNLPMAFLYYLVTAMINSGVVIFAVALIGLAYYLFTRSEKHRWLITLILGVPFVFNVITLFLGQSVIFIPGLTPPSFNWTLFNVRYGVMTVPLVAFLIGYLFYRVKSLGRLIILGLIVAQVAFYFVGYAQVISWRDGYDGLSSAKRPDAEHWLKENYDYGLVLMDDYARTVSVVRSGVPMENMIYIGNKPYWQESLDEPEKYARWIVMQQNDSIWKELLDNPAKQARLYKYFEKVYTSPEILIFRRQRLGAAAPQPFWNFQCIDTMKDSRDKAREWADNPDLPQLIGQQMDLIKAAGATCVSIGTPYDEEFVPFLTAWVQSAREHGLNIWFRGNMSGWEGWFDYPRFTAAAQQIQGVSNFIVNHKNLFKEGDIFTPAPEPENGILGDPRNSASSRQAFFDFLPKSYEGCLNAFTQIQVNVTCGYYSINGDIAKNIMTKDLLVKIGDVLVIDHHVKTPDQLAADILALNKKFGSAIVLGEFGAPIIDIQGNMTAEEQAQYLGQVMQKLYQERDILLGINYWVISGGSTTLTNGTDIRPAYNSIKNYYLPAEISGTVTDTLGRPVNNMTIAVPEYGIEVKTSEQGEYAIYVPAGKSTVKVDDATWRGEDAKLNAPTNSRTDHDITVEPIHKSLWYKIRLLFHRSRR
jgi:hypothetical protein